MTLYRSHCSSTQAPPIRTKILLAHSLSPDRASPVEATGCALWLTVLLERPGSPRKKHSSRRRKPARLSFHNLLAQLNPIPLYFAPPYVWKLPQKSYHGGHASPKYPRLAVKRYHNPYAEQTCLQADLAFHRFYRNKPKIRRPQASASILLFRYNRSGPASLGDPESRPHRSPQDPHDLGKSRLVP